MKLSRIALTFGLFSCFLTLAGVAGEAEATQATNVSDIPRILFEDPMTGDWRENWFLDGKEATLRNGDDGLSFAAGTIAKWHDPVKYHAHHAVLWTKREFAGNIRISFEMTRKDDGDGATLLYIQARGVGTPPYVKDIREWSDRREIPAMAEYYTYMDLLSISFREDLRLRRYPWKDKNGEWYPDRGLFEPKLDWHGMAPGESYFVEVEKRDSDLTLRLYTTDRKTLEVEHTWDTSKGAEHRDPPLIQEGRIGLRHMATRQLGYKNFRVEQLRATNEPGIDVLPGEKTNR